MSTFSLSQFAAALGRGAAAVTLAQHEIIEAACVVVENEAKRVIGTYDYGWPQLAPSTQADRERKGFSANEPLLRTGELRDSITHHVEAAEALGYVGSTSKVAAYQELGTSRIPARSFLGGASRAKEAEVRELMGAKVHTAVLTALKP